IERIVRPTRSPVRHCSDANGGPVSSIPATISPMERFDVIVAGVGAHGSAAVMELARRGARVLGLERSSIPNGRGSSHGVNRIIRLAYAEDPRYVPLLRRAYELWRDLERVAGEPLLFITGGV